MPYSKALAARVRQALTGRRGIAEKKMFGGVCFLHDGHMLVGIWQDSLIARIGADRAAVALGQEHVREFDVTGRPMRGWVMIEPNGLDTDAQLGDWLSQATDFVVTLPPKW